MDTATQVTLLVLVAAAVAGISQALHIQGSPGQEDVLLGSEENTLLGLVRGKYFHICSNSCYIGSTAPKNTAQVNCVLLGVSCKCCGSSRFSPFLSC